MASAYAYKAVTAGFFDPYVPDHPLGTAPGTQAFTVGSDVTAPASGQATRPDSFIAEVRLEFPDAPDDVNVNCGARGARVAVGPGRKGLPGRDVAARNWVSHSSHVRPATDLCFRRLQRLVGRADVLGRVLLPAFHVDAELVLSGGTFVPI